jgi:hypothetical protein
VHGASRRPRRSGTGGPPEIQRMGEHCHAYPLQRISGCHRGRRNSRLQFAAAFSNKCARCGGAVCVMGRCVSRCDTDHGTRLRNTKAVVRNRSSDGSAGNGQQVRLRDVASEHARQSDHGLFGGDRAGWLVSERYRDRRHDRTGLRHPHERIDRRIGLRLLIRHGSGLTCRKAQT